MPTEVLYRKWRPQRFADVSGQEAVKRTLTNALKTGRVSHAYLFSGPRGTGKTTMGRLLTKAINCERNAANAADADADSDGRSGEPCNECASCVAYNEGRALDLVELDGASNRGIDEVRKLRENAGYAPMAGAGAHKVYLIDEVHMLTEPAFNALLKTLEEPPPHIVFILATTDAHKVPATIVSRCQRLDFKRIPAGAIVDRLAQIADAEGIDAPREGLELIAQASTGSLRDAINLLEQICDSYGRAPTVDAVRDGLGLIADPRTELVAARALKGDLAGALKTVGEVKDDGLDLRQFHKELISHVRTLLLVQAGAESEGALTPEQAQEMRTAVDGVPRERVVRLLRLLSEAYVDLKEDPLSPLPIELALVESLAEPAAAPARAVAPQPAPCPAPTRAQEFSNRSAASRPAPAQGQRAASAQAAPSAPQRPAPPPQAPAADVRRDNITGASPEDIQRLVGKRADVIPPAGDEAEPAAPAPNGAGDDSSDLGSFVDKRLRPRVKQDPKLGRKLDAILNSNCYAVSWQDGVLTLGFFTEGYPKRTAESEHRKDFERFASELLGAPVSIRCIISARPARPVKSPLVQHAVENHGAKIVPPE